MLVNDDLCLEYINISFYLRIIDNLIDLSLL